MRRVAIIAALSIIAAVFLTACGEDGPDARQRSVEQRDQVFSKAESVAPTPSPSNFPTRKALVEFTERQDLENHPWYVYILSDLGTSIGYYVAKTRPVNSCNFLSSTEAVRSSQYGNLVLTAPSLDGIYYGGSGASSGCDAWFFFDSATDALIEIRGVKFFTTDQPLRLDADPIAVAQP